MLAKDQIRLIAQEIDRTADERTRVRDDDLKHLLVNGEKMSDADA